MHPFEDLKKSGDKCAGFFYNPNIHPYSEYLRRRDALEKYAVESGFNLLISNYDCEKYFQYIVFNEEPGKRCQVCWWLRMERTARFAKDKGFDAFTTTLLASPYQDHGKVKMICEDVAKNAGIEFYYKDFRQGFRNAHDLAKSKGIYCQNYCGCIFSERERIDKKKS
jgi:epoxyqueuosine reductase